MKKFFYILILLLIPKSSFADFSSYVRQYSQKLEYEKSIVFLTSCNLEKNKKYYEAVLIFELGSKKGLLIEKENGNIMNLATIIAGEKEIEIEETHGGVYSYERVKKLANELANFNFKVFIPFKVSDFQKLKSSGNCPAYVE